jgi:hypothetical protein
MTPLATWPDPTTTTPPPAESVRVANEVIELQLLLPRWQAAALESAARSRGMTTGQILRRVIADLFPPAADGRSPLPG